MPMHVKTHQWVCWEKYCRLLTANHYELSNSVINGLYRACTDEWKNDKCSVRV